jgi:hypothetical protein
VIDLPKAYKNGAIKRKSTTDNTNPVKKFKNVIDYDDVMAVEVFAYRQNLVNFAGW